MDNLSDQVFLTELKNENGIAFGKLYRLCRQSISTYVKHNSGSDEDAEDIFQEAIIILLGKLRQPDFLLTTTIKGYLYAVSKNLWLKKLRQQKSISILESHFPQDNIFDEAEVDCSHEQRLSIWFNSITKNCQRVLKAVFFQNISMEQLIVEMGWKNKHTGANQKYKCLKMIEKLKEKDG